MSCYGKAGQGPAGGARVCWLHPAPEDPCETRLADDKRVAGVERRYDFGRRESSEGVNPMNASGMKQGRKDGGRGNRQEGEKP